MHSAAADGKVMTRRPLSLYLIAAVVAASVSAATAATPWGDPWYFSCYLPLCVLATVLAVKQQRTRDRTPWLWVAAGQFLWLAGDAVYPLAALQDEPENGVLQAVLWTAGYLAYGMALTTMARRRAGRWLRPAVLDMLTLVTAATIIVWVVFVSPYLADAAQDPLNAYLTVMGPLGDVVILGGVLLLVFSPGTRSGATGLLVGSAVLRIASDLGLSFIPSDDLAIMVGTGVILLSNAVLVGAALHPNSGELTAAAYRAPTVHPARPWFLGVGLLTAPAILFLRANYAPLERSVLFAATIVTTMLVLIRFTAALRSLERIQRQLSFQATHDPLTGLLNRAALSERLEASPPGSTLLYLDLDGFKAVNDQAGHAAGDAILCAVSHRLRAAVRDCDAVARLGGDEFAVVLHGLGNDAAVAVAERLLRDVALPVEHDGAVHSVGVSIGIAGGMPPESGTDWLPATLLRVADSAMYQAKRSGRGRWVAAGAYA
ncbi:diguanylate cyclase domain-containing protein [Actinoplanes sp. NPDC051859]|uniref:diguanylate cyclase domain-containing protein n=1 Tax=Actinoplanes sp. NPDC051859 TaxID=3363909 RepID=UPI0037B78E73